MSAIRYVAVIGVALAVCGCVPSLHPLYTEKELVFDPGLVGRWTGDDKGTWLFERGDDEGKAYRLIYTDDDGAKGEFVVHLVQLGKRRFFDCFPEEPKVVENDFYKMHLMPIHTFMTVVRAGGTLRLSMMDARELAGKIEAQPDLIKHETVDGTLLLTASTAELQALLQKIPVAELFDDASELKRRVEPAVQ